MEKVTISLDEIWTHNILLQNPYNKNIIIRECSTNKNNLKIDLGILHPPGDSLNEARKMIIKPKESKTITISFTPASIGAFDCTVNIKTDEDFFMIMIRINVKNFGINFVADFLDLGVIYKRWVNLTKVL